MLSFTHRLALPLVLLALPACPVPEVVGDSPDETTVAATTADTAGTTGPEATTDPTEPDEGVTTGPGELETGTTGPFETSTMDDTETAGATETAGDTDTGGPSPAEFMAMEACDIADVCPLWTQNFAESEPYGEEPARLCVWEGLGAGTVGRYRYVTEHEFGNGHTQTTTIVHVHAERKLTFARHHVSFFEVGPDMGQSHDYELAMTCTLAAPELFESCPTVDIFESIECYWLSHPFDQETPWFTDCVAQGPMCE